MLLKESRNITHEQNSKLNKDAVEDLKLKTRKKLIKSEKKYDKLQNKTFKKLQKAIDDLKKYYGQQISKEKEKMN